MGAAPFTTYQPGADPADAFQAARASARHEHGHDRYTGTIAEKDTYTVITTTAHSYKDAQALAQQLIAAADERINNTRGPAGAIPVKQTTSRQPCSHSVLSPHAPIDAATLHQVTDRAQAAGLISEDETVTAARRYDHAHIPAETAEPDGWLFFGFARE